MGVGVSFTLQPQLQPALPDYHETPQAALSDALYCRHLSPHLCLSSIPSVSAHRHLSLHQATEKERRFLAELLERECGRLGGWAGPPKLAPDSISLILEPGPFAEE
jgi:hypothetical protein